MNNNEYFKQCLSKAAAAILLFDEDCAEVAFGPQLLKQIHTVGLQA